MPDTYHASEEAPLVCLVNASGKDVSLEDGSVIGDAGEAEPYVPVPYLTREVPNVAESGTKGTLPKVHAHLQDLLLAELWGAVLTR